MLVCFIYFAREAAGATGTRLSLRPLAFEGHYLAKLGRVAPREREAVSQLMQSGIRRAAKPPLRGGGRGIMAPINPLLTINRAKIA